MIRPLHLGRQITSALLFIAIAAKAAVAQDLAALDALVRAYPDYLAGYDATNLIWWDGTRMPLADGQPAKSFDEMLRSGSILDQIRLRYPAGMTNAPPAPDSANRSSRWGPRTQYTARAA